MSTLAKTASSKITIATLRRMKAEGVKIAMLTAYDYPTAAIQQEAGVDSILVGDSVAQVMLGFDSTIHATMDLMVTLSAAVRRGAPNVFLVGDMPFLSYQVSDEDAVRNAGRFLREGGCDAVKLEVDGRFASTVAAISRASIPVMAHMGLRPQSIHQLGGYRSQARDAESARTMIEDAQLMEEAGAAALLLEAVPPEPARIIAEATDLPVIGCGAGPDCDGHVVVFNDMAGIGNGPLPRFVQKYADLRTEMHQAVSRYVNDIRSRSYPGPDHCYRMSGNELDKLDKLES